MNAKCIIEFEDGSKKELDLGAICSEIDIQGERKQSLWIQQNHKGKFWLSFTKPLMDGKKFKRIAIEKISS